MANAWDERKKAMEEQYFKKLENEQIDRMKEKKVEETVNMYCHNRCPKCGGVLEAMTFREVPLDTCPDCHGVWLGPKDLKILAEKDHRTWFERWFRDQEG